MADNIRKIIWPIDPSSTQPQLEERLISFFKTFAQQDPIEIQPVYVLSVDYFLTSEYFEPINVAGLKENMTGVCDQYMEKFKDLPVKPTVILNNTFSARGAEVSRFCDYVDKTEPNFVVMTSHGRSGWARAFMGSFAERFLLQAKVPTIVIGPGCSPIQKLETALMPVQLNDSSKQFIEGFLDDHRLSFLKNLTLFHKISMIDMEAIAWAPTLYGLNDFSSDDVVKKARESTSRYLKRLEEHPLSQKRLHSLLSEKLAPIGEVIVEEAEKGDFDLVVMRTEAGTLEANILGSVTRDVVRTSSVPVIVYPHLFDPNK